MGWDLGLLGLGVHLSTGETLDPEEFRSWERTPEAHAYIAESSTAWGEASIAGGADAEAARASAAGVTDFYTLTEE